MTQRWWGQARHRAAIGGQVVDERTKRPVSDAVVVLTGVPDEFKARWEASMDAARQSGPERVNRLDLTRTSAAGYYYFLDLPKGMYELTATGFGRTPPVGTGKAKVSLDQDGNVVMTTVDLTLKYRKEDPQRL